MAVHLKEKRDMVREYLRRFPKAGSLSIGKMLYRDHGALWPSLEAARSSVRSLRGNNGGYHRSKIHDPEFKRPNQATGDPFGKLPESIPSFDEVWGAVPLDGPAKCLVVSDIHIPFHDRDAVIAALKYGKERGADMVILLGDIADCFAVSFWEKDPRKRKFSEEIKSVKAFLDVVRETFPKGRIIYKLGNHEDRLERYMRVKAPELLGVPEFEFQAMFGLDANKIQLVKDNRPIRLGKLNLIHGHEYRFAISNPVNPARGLFLRGKSHGICGHFHQSSQHTERTLEQRSISTWSLGCLCDLHPEYSVLNNWTTGFGFVEVDKAGAFTVQNLRIVNGIIY
jgi:predicted phosphodiesterase